MARGSSPILWSLLAAGSAPLGLYLLFLTLGVQPFFQRHFIYAHRINSNLWHDVNDPERWGFARGQVIPFSLTTPDSETLHGWHILPLPVYLKNEAAVSQQKPGFCDDFSATESFRLLRDDPDARVVLYFHGNAGHVAQNHRPKSYHVLADASYHIFSFDYRGFGLSTGSPTEEGLIQDAAALVDYVLHTVGIPSSRIVLLGQSLGTAVVAGVAERFATAGVEFAGIVLVAGFSHLPSMLSGYRIGGVIPVLSPLGIFPGVMRRLQDFIVDQWPSADRLARIVRLTRNRVRISLVAARDDRDIPTSESDILFRAAANATAEKGLDEGTFRSRKEAQTIDKGTAGFVTTWTEQKPDIIIRQELFPHGGHNDIMGYAPVPLAVMRCFDLGGTVYSD